MADQEEHLVVSREEAPGLNDNGQEHSHKKIDKKSTLAAMFSLIISIPALIGASASVAARHTAHLATLLVDIVVIGGLCIYVTYKARDRFPYPFSWWEKWGPTVLCWIGFPLICAYPLRHVLSDNDIWKSCERRCGEVWPLSCDYSSNEYKCALPCYPTEGDSTSCDINDKSILSCVCVHDSQENIAHLAIIGWIFTIGCTYIGFALFMFGSLWSANICDKCRAIRHKWRVLRGMSVDSEDDYNY